MKCITKERIYRRDSYECIYCGASAIEGENSGNPQGARVKLHLDHVIPVVYGGSNTAANVVTSCAGCNLTKSTDISASERVLAVVATRNEEDGIEPGRVVDGVREKNDPRKVVAIRLSEEDEQYCKDNNENGNCGAFIRSLIEYHKAEVERRDHERIRVEAVLGVVIEEEREKRRKAVSNAILASRSEVGSLKSSLHNANATITDLVMGKPQKPTKAKVPTPKVLKEYDYEETVKDLSEL